MQKLAPIKACLGLSTADYLPYYSIWREYLKIQSSHDRIKFIYYLEIGSSYWRVVTRCVHDRTKFHMTELELWLLGVCMFDLGLPVGVLCVCHCARWLEDVWVYVNGGHEISWLLF
jgi:hypothetical protein